MITPPSPSSGVPVYLQLIEQVKHAIATGALRPGDQLPGIRKLAEELTINPNTIVKVYHELEHEGLIEVRHGLGAFVARRAARHDRVELLTESAREVAELVERLRSAGVTDAELRRLLESELVRVPDRARVRTR